MFFNVFQKKRDRLSNNTNNRVKSNILFFKNFLIFSLFDKN